MAAAPHKVGEILDCLDERAGAADSVSVADIIGSFGRRTFGPAIMVPALLELTPVGAIPGVPTFLAVIIVLVAAQKLFGRKHIWLPGFIGNRCVSSAKLAKSTRRLRGLARFMDRHFHGRLEWLTRSPFSLIAAGLVIVLATAVPFLEVLPFASSGPMLAIAMFGLAILVRDGVLMIAALAISLAALGMGVDWYDGGMSDTQQVDGIIDEEQLETAKDSAAKAGESLDQTRQEVTETAGETIEEVRAQTAEKTSETLETGSGAVSGD